MAIQTRPPRDAEPPDVLAPELRIDPRRWERVLSLARSFTECDEVPAVALCAGRGEWTTGVFASGRHRLNDKQATLEPEAVFLVASLTKPLVAMGVLLLVERGELFLGDRVSDLVPEFKGDQKNGVTVRHLLTHTSGLPDQLPNNRELRAAHAPLSRFVEETCAGGLSFPPGRGVQYQSMGFLLLGEIIHRVTGRSCPEFLREEFFTPLAMHDTFLGAPNDWFTDGTPKKKGSKKATIVPPARVAEIRVPEDAVGEDWNWNSRYWQTLGAPWGGLLSTASDLSKFCRMMLEHGHYRGRQILSRASIEASTRNQLEFQREVPENDRRCKPWGFGWRLNWPAHSANFGDLTGPYTFGHWGATGTLMWMDPQRDVWAVILTTQPQEPNGTYLGRLSNAIAAAFL